VRRHQSFDGYAAAYAAFSGRTHRPVLPLLAELGVPTGGARAVDLGCGAGHTVAELASAYDEVVGVDLSEPLLDLARRHVPGARFVAADLATFHDGGGDGFDLVFSSTALHHVDDLPRALANVRALTRPGGWVVLRDVVRMADPRLVWLWRHGGFLVGPLADAVARRTTLADLRFQLRPAWIRHLLADRWLTFDEFKAAHETAFPGAQVLRRDLATVVWQKSH
jgi:SAM-dependent methyltransferase